MFFQASEPSMLTSFENGLLPGIQAFLVVSNTTKQVPINLTKFQVMIVLNSPAKIALRKGYCINQQGASLGRVHLQISRKRHRTLCISLLPGTDSTGRVFVCLSERALVFSLGWLHRTYYIIVLKPTSALHKSPVHVIPYRVRSYGLDLPQGTCKRKRYTAGLVALGGVRLGLAVLTASRSLLGAQQGFLLLDLLQVSFRILDECHEYKCMLTLPQFNMIMYSVLGSW